MRIDDGIEMLEIEVNVMGTPSIINPILLWDDKNTILIDTGYPKQLPKLRETIEKAGIPFNRLNKIILTHQDIDHVGGVQDILRELHNVQVIAYEEEKPYIDGEKTPIKLAQLEAKLNELPDSMKKIYESLKDGFEYSKSQVDKTVVDEEELPYCGGIVVIFTPGHTLGHICLYHKKSKTLIAGDALGIEDGKLAKPIKSATYDMNLSLQSLKKLEKYDIKTVVCYHGGIYTGEVNKHIAELSDEKL